MAVFTLLAGKMHRCMLSCHRPKVGLPGDTSPRYLGMLLVSITLVGLGRPSAQAEGFIVAPAYPGGPGTISMAAGDFNGDGILDFAVARLKPGTSEVGSVVILLGNGDGSFHVTGVEYTPGGGDLAVGDFNGDGKLDLAVLPYYGGGAVSILLGNGDGTFQAPQAYSAGLSPSSLAVGDFNGDGKLDLIVANAVVGRPTVSILLGNGDGTFQAPLEQLTNAFAFSLVIGDFNGDGYPDLALPTYGTYPNPGTVTILLGNGDGTFHFSKKYSVDLGHTFLTVGDFNGDGIVDLAVVNQQGGANFGTLSVLLGNGDGTFQAAAKNPIDPAGGSFVVGDFNGDGYLDIALQHASGIRIYLGNGDGTFQTGQTYAAKGGYLIAGDFNADGHLDLAVASSGTVTVLLGHGDGTFAGARSYADHSGNVYSFVAVGDFNRDGVPDLALIFDRGTGLGTVSILLGNGDGTFQEGQSYFPGSIPVSVVVADLNGDGIPDIAVAADLSDKGTVSVLLGNGDGTFQSGPSVGIDDNINCIAVGDFNGDGIPDLAVASGYTVAYGPIAGKVSILLGTGDGTFRIANTFAAGYGPFSLVVGDFNGDGKQDIVTANHFLKLYPGDRTHPPPPPDTIENDLRVFLGNGDGTFNATGILDVGVGSVAVGDFNGDGFLDLAVGGVSILLGNGDGSFQPAQAYAGGSTSLTVADFNKDGIPDLVGLNSRDGSVSILLGNGDGSFQAAQNYPVSGLAVGVGDFNRDGFPDLAVAGGVAILINAADWSGGP